MKKNPHANKRDQAKPARSVRKPTRPIESRNESGNREKTARFNKEERSPGRRSYQAEAGERPVRARFSASPDKPFKKPYRASADAPDKRTSFYEKPANASYSKPFSRRSAETEKPPRRNTDSRRPFAPSSHSTYADKRKKFDREERPANRETEIRQPFRQPFADKKRRDADEPRQPRDFSAKRRQSDDFPTDRKRAPRTPYASKEKETDTRKPFERKYAPKSAPTTFRRNFVRRGQEIDKDNPHQPIRLNRYIANAGICSRRDADLLIEAGEIRVNSKIVTEMGYRVNPSDVVKYGNRTLNREKMVYLLLNKPKDFITTTDDPDERKTVMDLVRNACEQRIYPVGRLDRNTTGLLLFTNDGETAGKLAHPSNNVKKIYQVELNKPIAEKDFLRVQEGVELEDGKAVVDELSIVSPDATIVGMGLHIGRNRIVRRIFEHLGYEVVRLDRVAYAGLTKKDLPRGKWRFLSEKEVIRLKYFV